MTAQTDAALALKRLIERDNKHMNEYRARRERERREKPAPAQLPNETVQQYMKRLKGEA